MLSNFQTMESVWLWARFTVALAPKVNTRPEVLHDAASALQVATSLKVLLLRVPAAPVALSHVAEFQVTSEADHVVAPATGGVKDAAAACTEILSCLVAVARCY
jgi:hypothetical protein